MDLKSRFKSRLKPLSEKSLKAFEYWQSFSLKMRVFIITLLFFGIFLTVLPYGIKWGMKQALLKQGLEEVHIEDVSFNLFTGRFKVENMLLKKAGKEPLKLGEFFFDFDWPSLFEKHLVVDKLILLKTHVHVDFQPKKFLDVAGIIIPLNKETPKEEPADGGLTWKLGINSLVLKNTVVSVIAPNIDKDVRFEEVALNHLQNWEPSMPADMTFKLEVGKGKEYGGFKGHMKVNAFSETQKLVGQVEINNLLLQAYEKFLPPEVEQLAAKVGGKINVSAFNKYGDVQAKVNSDLKLENGIVQTKDLQADVGKITFNGESDVSLLSGELKLQNDAKLSIQNAGLNTSDVSLKVGGLTLEGTRNVLHKDQSLQVKANESLTIQHTALKQKGNQLSFDDLQWKGHVETQKDTKTALNVDGTLQLAGINLSQKALVLYGKTLSWQGNTDLDIPSESKQKLKVKTQGKVALDKWTLTNTRKDLLMSSFDSLDSQVGFALPLSVSVKDFSLDEVTVAQFKHGKTKQEHLPLAQLKSFNLKHFNLVGTNKINVGKMDVNSLKVNLDFDENKHIHQFDALMASLPIDQKTPAKKQTTTHSKTDKKAKPSSLQLMFDGLDFKGYNRVELLTHATQPAMHKNIDIRTLSIGKLSYHHPNRNTPIRLLATIDKYTKVDIKGKAKPLTKKVNMDVTTHIHDMDLYSFSPLIKRDLGYRIQSGSLNLTSDVKVKDDMLTSKNHVLLVGFDMEADDSDQTQPKAQGTENAVEKTANEASGLMSATALKFGLNMLRDSRDNIDLDLPVNGDLSDPGFDATSAINIALRNALTGGTKLALTLALQPYGAIAMATSYAYNQANKIQFQSVSFVAGKNELSAGMTEYLDKMGKLLKEKKQITLKVCGYYTQQDVDLLTEAIRVNDANKTDNEDNGLPQQQKQAGQQPLSAEAQVELNQQLYDLAKSRQRLVKDWLVEKDGIDPSRLTTCHPELEQEKVTGVSLSM
ncbi:DUF748 domain-containing protein [Hydrogenovibrio marinus]|uniref:DUF748 domain-containing protein n=1 Tax=Hydrogenovibrio marinus TaxID=28885 RepID=A0A066ZZS4_HYDMR|nr:DUF748 domain-containing protein [Hydrogenovibrio marinus]KDN95605.1 hypothetical protein EI16_04700 [Hydrogenovibrio marinus]BBN60100.1 hypothetical protein HVMH_1694 [Hydrogenovibrio marinus]